MPDGTILVVVATEAERPPADLCADSAAPRCEVLVCGVGKTGAAAATAARLAQGGVSAVVSFGIAGAYPAGGLGIGDVVVATEVAVLDEGLETGESFLPFSSPIGRPGMPVPAAMWAASDADLLDRLLSGPQPSFRVEAGRIATVSVCAGTSRLAEERGRSGAVAEGMEGAAAAWAARACGVPFVEIRGISNPCGPRGADGQGAPFDLRTAATNAAVVLRRLFP